MQDELGIFLQDTQEGLGEVPTLIGEIGCPYDMDDKKAYGYVDGGKGEGDYSLQSRAWDASMNAMDGPNCLNFTLWTYVPDNNHEFGDNWNGEDLSLWSPEDLENPQPSTSIPHTQSGQSLSTSTTSSNTLVSPSGAGSVSPKAIASGAFSSSLVLDGARAIDAICRPFPIATVGKPESLHFDVATSELKLNVRVGPEDAGAGASEGVTEVYLPFVHYANTLGSSLGGETEATTPAQADKMELSIDVKVSKGTTSTTGQTLYWKYDAPTTAETLTLTVRRKGGAIVRPKSAAAAAGEGGSWGDVCPSCIIA